MRTFGAAVLAPLAVAAALVCAPLSASAPVSASASAPGWQQPWAEPRSEALTADSADEFAWRLFIALNWPADLEARRADPKAAFGADAPVVWETWQSAGAIFLNDGRDPGPWTGGSPAASGASHGSGAGAESRFETLSLKDFPNARHIVGGRMVPLADPLANASRLTEIRMNRRSYEFIRSRELYNLDGQVRAYAAAQGVEFPLGARHVKAKWRPIKAEERSRYHTVEVAFADGSTRLYGLTALHIASKDQPHWLWATFEHVDNPALPDNEGWQLPSRDRFACRGTAQDCNRAPPSIGLEGTVWQYYRLRGTLTSYVDGAGRPERLASSELENGMQGSSSCMTCHSRASIGVVAGAPERLPIFIDPAPGELKGDARARRGYVGLPKEEWFTGTPGAGQAPVFRPQDFVWSLSKARPRRDAGSMGLLSKQFGDGSS